MIALSVDYNETISMVDATLLSLAIVVVFCIYNIVLGAGFIGLLKLLFVRMHGIQHFFRNTMILPLLIVIVVTSLIPYAVSPFVLNFFPTLEIEARTYELTQLAGTMLHLNMVAVALFFVLHWFRLSRDFMDTQSKVINFFEMSLETFLKLLFVGVLIALLLVFDATVHPEVFKIFSAFNLSIGGVVSLLLLAALELGYRLFVVPEPKT